MQREVFGLNSNPQSIDMAICCNLIRLIHVYFNNNSSQNIYH